MQDEPTPPEILQAVADFLRHCVAQDAAAPIAYQARVAAAALELVRRQWQQAGAGAEELARLRALLGQEGSLFALNAILAEQLASGAISLSDPAVAAHVWATTRAKLAVDQPRYWGLPPPVEEERA